MTAPEPTPPEEVAAAAPHTPGVKFDYGGFDFDGFDPTAGRHLVQGSTDPAAEGGTNRLKTVGRFILGLLLLGGVATGIAAWFYHAHEVELRPMQRNAAAFGNHQMVQNLIHATGVRWPSGGSIRTW
jgi:hypothetical protein